PREPSYRLRSGPPQRARLDPRRAALGLRPAGREGRAGGCGRLPGVDQSGLAGCGPGREGRRVPGPRRSAREPARAGDAGNARRDLRGPAQLATRRVGGFVPVLLAALVSVDPFGHRPRPGTGAAFLVRVAFMISFLAIRTTAGLTRTVSWWPGGGCCGA